MQFIHPLHYNKLIQPFNEIIDKFFDYLIINKVNSPEFFFLRRCNTGKKIPIGRNANYLTFGHSQVLANVARPKGALCHESPALPLPKETINKGVDR